ncbi:hypothetical protein FHETE_6572 [Fusarium heterosporum]|uniref:Uncharacterized protein n=1 Tax=Fusarium heterosporum TaxID=42747 RepID=A0A8H5T4U3_FUSHE|nr:hypothetical protein FHETE_6572 [Fusarium heterosporum]
MGFSHNTTSWQATSPQSFPTVQSDPNGVAVNNKMTRSGETGVQNIAESHNQREVGKADNAMEEGELSEGELEDIYEPDETAASGVHQYDGQPSSSLPHLNRQDDSSRLPIGLQPGQNVDERTWNSKQFGRDRSGSYSPYLSPREISGLESGISRAQSSGSGIVEPTTTRPAVLAKNMHPSSSTHYPYREAAKRNTDEILSESKRQAKEAILRLRPLNIRYHDYIEEGIDRILVDELFKELGIDLGTVPSQGQSQTTSLSQAANAPSNAHDTEVPSVGLNAVTTETKTVNQTKDKSEERKDRIARLLAAKGSKTTAVGVDEGKVATPKHATIGSTKSEKPTAQSEKSKLIQRKMEALMRAREANGKVAPPILAPQEPQLSQSAPETGSSPSPPLADSINVDEQSGIATETVDPAGVHPIPGLFLSSSAPSPIGNQRKRPVAADLNENSAPPSQKRPFGQARESRPFLIDVSDDEDDAEMDIDSPELLPSSIRQAPTPDSRTASFRDYPTLTGTTSRHTVSSPKTAGTPTTSANGMYDLESMNKKIEDMKRRIAEAEARKKAKQSGNNSPLPQSEPQSKEGSVDVSVPLAFATRAVPTTMATIQDDSTPATSQPSSPHPVAKLPKVRGQPQLARPSLRARVASERLPVLEARLKEQAEQLRHYESEIARIKLEMENSLAEEERLRKDAIQIDAVASTEDESEPDTIQSKATDEGVPGEKDTFVGVHGIHADRCLVDTPQQEPVLDDTLTSPTENHSSNVARDEIEQDASMDESSSTGSMDSRRTNEHYQNAPQLYEQSMVAESKTAHGHSSPIAHDATDETAIEGVEDPEEDVAMEEADTSSEEEDAAEEVDSDDYEPTDAVVSLPDPESLVPRESPLPQALVDNTVLETSDTDLQGLSMTTPITQSISRGDGDTESESGREVDNLASRSSLGLTNVQVAVPRVSQASDGPETTFVPYQTPLQYFRAYRFHPQYDSSVAGGLRSLTYSNKIDVTREVCPDQLTQGVCPRGTNKYKPRRMPMEGTLTCRAATDDQILLQLGANCEVEQHEEYVAGLRKLLTDFRNRKVKDFEAISKGIIEYRASFLGDKTKILPLGGVTL